jgi:hypothetical protein
MPRKQLEDAEVPPPRRRAATPVAAVPPEVGGAEAGGGTGRRAPRKKPDGVDGQAAPNRAPAPADPPAVKAAATSPRARKAAGEKKVSAKPATAEERAAAAQIGATLARAARNRVRPPRPEPQPPSLKDDLRAFVLARPGGWDHEDWVYFLDHLREQGHDTSNPEAIGLLLERERLAARLEGIQGMGPRRIQSVVDRYETLWSASHADVDEIAALPGMNRSLAERVRQVLHA